MKTQSQTGRKGITLGELPTSLLKEVTELRQSRTGKAKEKQQEIFVDALNLLIEQELSIHPYKAKLTPTGSRLDVVGGRVVLYNADYQINIDSQRGDFIVHHKGIAYALAKEFVVNEGQIAEMIAKFDAKAPAKPITVDEAECFSLYWQVMGCIRFELGVGGTRKGRVYR